jgi:hypothetical protein
MANLVLQIKRLQQARGVDNSIFISQKYHAA